MKRLVVVAVGLLLTACSDEDGARRVLQAQGFQDIHITGYRFFGCSERDLFHTGFNAVSVKGAHVTGIVCRGWLKGSTVRFD